MRDRYENNSGEFVEIRTVDDKLVLEIGEQGSDETSSIIVRKTLGFALINSIRRAFEELKEGKK